MPARRVFACRRCGTALEKVSNRLAVVSLLILAVGGVSRREGIESPVTWTALGVCCVVALADALFVGKVRRASLDGSVASESSP